MWSEEKIQQKLAYLRKQKDIPTGNYRRYLVNIYNYILEDSQKSDVGWINGSSRAMLNYIYEGAPDHMGVELIDGWKKELKETGYIKWIKESDEWHVYINKALDF